MSRILLTADWHIDDNPANEYRWSVLGSTDYALRNTKANELYILGDLTDRKDRHSAELVNRLVDGFRSFKVPTTILRGNHDSPLRGHPFWQFLSAIPNLSYVDTPTARRSQLLLPSSPDPRADWEGISWSHYDVIFMHQPVRGAMLENGRKLDIDDHMPVLPRDLQIYSGDIHTPHSLRNLTYVGAPHPVKFGDTYTCRMIVVDDDDWRIVDVLPIAAPRKVIAEISSLKELEEYKLRPGDQARVRFMLDPNRADEWSIEQQEITEWAAKRNVTLTSVEGPVMTEPTNDVEAGDEGDPEAVYTAYADAENLDDDLYDAGLRILRRVRER